MEKKESEIIDLLYWENEEKIQQIGSITRKKKRVDSQVKKVKEKMSIT